MAGFETSQAVDFLERNKENMQLSDICSAISKYPLY